MEESNKDSKPPKRKGPIRWEAVVPLTLIFALVWAYFFFLFDLQMRKTLEWLGTKAVGAEVNVASFKTSFWKASLRIQGVEVTDAEKPTHNAISIGDIRFSALWDALLRVKFVVNEAAVEEIKFGQLRKRPGRVLPPPPPEEQGPSFLEKEGEKLKNEALEKVQDQYNDNVLGDIAALLGGGSAQVQLDQLRDGLVSKKMIEDLEKDIKKKQKEWEERLKKLPQAKEFQALGDRLGKVKIKDFKSPQELQASITEIDKILKEAEAKYKELEKAGQDAGSQISVTQKAFQEIEAQIRKDIKELERHFKIPQFDAKALTLSLFRKYLDPYLDKANKYKALAEKYVPPNILKKIYGKDKNEKVEDEIDIQPHPRQKGITYEFGRKNSYPLFWIKKTLVSSQAGSSPGAGNISGQVTDITSHQALVGRPTVLALAGDFPESGIHGFESKLSLDFRASQNLISTLLKVKQYPIDGRPLVQSGEVNLGFKKASGSLDVKADLKEYRNLILQVENRFQNVEYEVQAKNNIVEDILKKIFSGLPSIYLKGRAEGVLPKIPFDVESNVGTELQRGFEREIQAKIEEAKKKIQAYIDEQIGIQKKRLEEQIAQLRAQVENEIKKLQEQAEAQKKMAEAKINQAKKDAEDQINRERKKAEDKAKKDLENEGKKKLDELKKKFGF